MSRRTLPLMLLLICGLVVPQSRGSEYTYDQAHSRVTFTLKHLGIITVSGEFRTFSGTFRFDPEKIEEGRVDISISTASVDSANKMRDKSLRSKSFFWSEKYPDIHFVSHRFRKEEGSHFAIDGDLTIRGITRPVVFKTVRLPVSKSATEEGRLFFRSHTEIKRADYKLGTGNWLDPIMLITDETLTITLEVVGLPLPE